jgi:molybdopterin converting factor small subunit
MEQLFDAKFKQIN